MNSLVLFWRFRQRKGSHHHLKPTDRRKRNGSPAANDIAFPRIRDFRWAEHRIAHTGMIAIDKTAVIEQMRFAEFLFADDSETPFNFGESPKNWDRKNVIDQAGKDIIDHVFVEIFEMLRQRFLFDLSDGEIIIQKAS
jgi:hypothetical protein